MPGGLTAVDWTIILLYALGTVVLGYTCGRRQKTTREYFTGSGRMNPMLIGFSMFATLLSTISYLAVPGEAISKGPGGLLNFLAYPFAFLIVVYAIIPVYMRSRVTSAYELLEERLGVRVRLLGAVLFLLLRLTWMSLLVFLSAKAVTVMLGVDESWIPLVTLLTGLVAVLYTSLGGLRAVVITDTFQALLMFGGACLAIGLVTWELGGLSWIPTGWQPHWDVQPLFSFDPGVRISILGSIFYVFVLTICVAGGDQTMVQRFMATRDVRAARRAYLTHLIVSVVIIVSLWTVGFALLGYFQEFPGKLPGGIELIRNGDDVFPYYIAYMLPPGVSGLVVSAMFAAAMSSIDSGVNSITAVVTRDFLARFGRLPDSERKRTRIAKILAFAIGGVSRGGRFLPAACAREHLGGEQQDLLAPDGARLRALLLRFLRSLCQASGSGCGHRPGDPDRRVDRLLRAPLRYGSGHGTGPGQLHVGGARPPWPWTSPPGRSSATGSTGGARRRVVR